MVAETTDEEWRNVTVVESDAFNMISMMAEAAEAPMTTEMKNRVLKMLE